MRQSIINKLNSNNMSKKVIEQIKVVKYFGKGEKEPTVIDNPSESELTTVAKAIDSEYQKVIYQNAKLVEALEELIRLKSMKDNVGKTLEYTELMPIAWKNANQALQNNKKIEG